MTLQCRIGDAAYSICVGRDVLGRASEFFDLGRKVLVVTDEGVPAQYASSLISQCREGFLLVLPQGEEGKSLDGVRRIFDELLSRGFTRSDAMVAVGGGVVGDMAGFAAACWMRGIDFYNVPTTLLSQVDSSVGGKTGVNFGGVKNVVGAFHQPAGVLIDTATLDTLGPRLFGEGLAEVIKMAATGDAELFRLLENRLDLLPVMPEIIAAALRYKISVVEQDPRESGLRAVLNFGHTIGHAIEAAGNSSVQREGLASDFPDDAAVPRREQAAESVAARGHVNGRGPSLATGGTGEAKIPQPTPSGERTYAEAEPAFYHGEAVAVGMLYMAEGEARDRINAVLEKYSLPTSDPFSADELMTYAVHDKKSRGGIIRTVRVDRIGSFRFEDCDAAALEKIIRNFKDR